MAAAANSNDELLIALDMDKCWLEQCLRFGFYNSERELLFNIKNEYGKFAILKDIVEQVSSKKPKKISVISISNRQNLRFELTNASHFLKGAKYNYQDNLGMATFSSLHAATLMVNILRVIFPDKAKHIHFFNFLLNDLALLSTPEYHKKTLAKTRGKTFDDIFNFYQKNTHVYAEDTRAYQERQNREIQTDFPNFDSPHLVLDLNKISLVYFAIHVFFEVCNPKGNVTVLLYDDNKIIIDALYNAYSKNAYFIPQNCLFLLREYRSHHEHKQPPCLADRPVIVGSGGINRNLSDTYQCWLERCNLNTEFDCNYNAKLLVETGDFFQLLFQKSGWCASSSEGVTPLRFNRINFLINLDPTLIAELEIFQKRFRIEMLDKQHPMLLGLFSDICGKINPGKSHDQQEIYLVIVESTNPELSAALRKFKRCVEVFCGQKNFINVTVCLKFVSDLFFDANIERVSQALQVQQDDETPLTLLVSSYCYMHYLAQQDEEKRILNETLWYIYGPIMENIQTCSNVYQRNRELVPVGNSLRLCHYTSNNKHFSVLNGQRVIQGKGRVNNDWGNCARSGGYLDARNSQPQLSDVDRVLHAFIEQHHEGVGKSRARGTSLPPVPEDWVTVDPPTTE